ncbi:MAG: hypothetical protein MUF25_28235 [Pirellulaceae bacterium]|nr:hypothetical protein [Pirellulaceae bacterium]
MACNQHLGQQRGQSGQHKPLEPLGVTFAFLRLDLAARQVGQVIFVDLTQIVGPRASWDVRAGSLERDFLQQPLVHPRPDFLAFVLQVANAARRVADRDAAAFLGIAQADCKDLDLAFSRLFRSFLWKRILVLAVRDQDDDPIAIAGHFQRFDSLADRIADQAAAARSAVCVHAFQGSQEKTLVAGQRHDRGRGTGKGNQPHAVARQLAEQVADVRFGPLQPVRGDVFGQHGSGDIQQHE